MSATPAPVVDHHIASLDEDLGADAPAIVRTLASRLVDAGRVTDLDAFVEAVLAREAIGSTVLPGGIAMPHARSHAVTTPSVAVARLPVPVVFHEGAEPVGLVLLVAAPDADPQGYLSLLQKVATACVKPAFAIDLAEARTQEGLAEVARAGIERR